MNVLSAKTNTVLVSKNLSQAQFRCLECQKVFISYRHLEKHTVRRHRESLLNMNCTDHCSATADQHEAISANDRKLIEVAGRLENVLSLLEIKAAQCVDRRASTAWVGPSPGASPDNLSPILTGNCKNIYVLPASVSEVRKSVSLFTLPNTRKMSPEFRDFGMKDEELCHNSAKEQNPKNAESSEFENSVEISKQELTADEQEETSSANSAKTDAIQKSLENIPKEVSHIPTCIGREHIEAAGSLGTLIVDLINKLENISIEPKRVVSSCVQTSDTEKDAVLTGAHDREPIVIRKSVSFSENPVTIISNADEEDSHQSDSESASKSENEESGRHSSVELDENGSVEENGNQSCTVSVEDEECFGESDLADCMSSSDSASKNRPLNQNIMDKRKAHISNVEPGEIVETPKDSCTHHDREHYENGHTIQKMLVRFPDVERERENERTLQPGETNSESEVITPEVPLCSRSPMEFAQTKKQILDLIEKCVVEYKSSSATTLKSESSRSNVSEAIEIFPSACKDQNNTAPGRKYSKVDPPKVRETEECELLDGQRVTGHTVCVKYDSMYSVPGLVAPSSIICRDRGLDIDDMSGNSYEQFMKRFSSDFLKDRKIIEDQIDRISLACRTSANSIAGCADSCATMHPDDDTVRNQRLEIPDALPPLTRRNRSDTLVCHKSGALEMKKSEYAVLLHHETSQVQNLIDTLVSDVQRWKIAKKNELSKAIRIQLEEKLSSNLNLLGVNNKSKTLSDTAMASTTFLLDNRRSKVIRGSQSSYFDTLKTAFETEIDRIAKSRTDYPL